MNEYIKQLEAIADDIILNKPADIDTLMSASGAYGSKVTCLFSAKSDIQAAWAWLLQQHKTAKNDGADLPTLNKIISTYLVFLGDQVQNQYGLEHTAVIAHKSAELLTHTQDREELAALLWALQRYFGQLAYWCDLTIPWCGLSVAYEELMAAGQAAYGV